MDAPCDEEWTGSTRPKFALPGLICLVLICLVLRLRIAAATPVAVGNSQTTRIQFAGNVKVEQVVIPAGQSTRFFC